MTTLIDSGRSGGNVAPSGPVWAGNGIANTGAYAPVIAIDKILFTLCNVQPAYVH